MERHTVPTPWGAVEYAELGHGDPVLVVHGIFQGCDGGLRAVRDQLRDRRLIAPSRFGYLGSSLPAGATPAAQADAFVVLLDALGIDRVDVIGVSAGSTSVLQLALRHPERIKRLVLLSGNFPGGRTAVVPPAWSRSLNADLPLWTIKVFAPSTMAHLVGVPRAYPMTGAEGRQVAEFIDSLFPIAAKTRGVNFDAFVSNADVNRYELEAITVPTLVVHAKDDPLASYDAAVRAAERIPGARLVSVESGGHLLLGQAETIRHEAGGFLAGGGTD